MTKQDHAADAFAKGYSCTQAVLGAFANDLGMDRDTAIRVAAGFGGGLGRQGHVCGAVTGAIMVLGLSSGPANPGDQAAKERIYAQVRDFCSRFQQAHGSIQCNGLLGCDIGTPEGLAAAREKKLFTTQCPAYVRGAVSIVEELTRS